MTLTELRYIVTLAQCNHFGQAADRCNVTQPTLSIAVKKLEGELGVNIFERSKSNVQLTPIGQQIVEKSPPNGFTFKQITLWGSQTILIDY